MGLGCIGEEGEEEEEEEVLRISVELPQVGFVQSRCWTSSPRADASNQARAAVFL